MAERWRVVSIQRIQMTRRPCYHGSCQSTGASGVTSRSIYNTRMIMCCLFIVY